MSGSIFGLGLSQRVDTNGKPDIGWLLYLYQANSSTPVTAYKDTGLTAGLEHPWPIVADSAGMMPDFWLADGSYRARATSADGSRIFFDLQNVLALGASSGSGGGGSGVDPNAIFQTGDTMFQEVSGTRSGWVRDNGRTIGSATSGASERANSDCQALFEWVWNHFADTVCPVPGGRGASAVADWSANKQITLLDKRGVGPIGLDDMGNSAASKFTGVPFERGNATTAGSICGEAIHALTKTESPSGLVTLNFNDPGHTHTIGRDFAAGQGGGAAQVGGVASTINTGTSLTGITASLTDHGGNASHNNTQRSITGTWYRKL